MSKKDPVKGRTGLVKRGAAGGGSGNGPGGAKRGAGTESTGLSGAGRVNRRRRGKEAVVGGFKGCRECGGEIPASKMINQKLFCSDKCRMRNWHRKVMDGFHRSQEREGLTRE